MSSFAPGVLDRLRLTHAGRLEVVGRGRGARWRKVSPAGNDAIRKGKG
jgi:hypothetical protein